MKAGELASWLLTQQEDLEFCIWKDNEAGDGGDYIPIEWDDVQLSKKVNYSE